MSILIAESGSSKTDWRLIDNEGNISQFKTLGFNPYYQEEESIFLEVSENVIPYIKIEINKIFYYGTGITNADKSRIIQNVFERAFSNATIEINDDMVAAARSLCGNEAGIACILGTGSNSCFYDGQKIANQIPPLGFWLGDEGSGGYLGKELIKKYIRKELSDEIQQKFIKKFGNLERTEILDRAYKQPFPNRYFAGFSKFLFDNRADPTIYLIVLEAFSQFFEKSVVKYPNYQNYKVHFTGSVAFYYSDILRKTATKYGVTIGVILESPIAGLVLYHKIAE
ncbi:MAG: N-acetylglucosamine kinase [Bacteroidota bacterium]